MANLGNALNILHISQIIRTGKVHRRNGRLLCQRLCHLLRRHRTADIAAVCLRIEPPDVDIQQGGGIDESLMGIAGRQNMGSLPF